MELKKYNNINSQVFKDFHFKHKTFLNKCTNCKETYILKNKNNYLGIYKYPDNIEIYIKRFTLPNNLGDMLEYILKNFKVKDVIAVVSIKNKNLKKIVNVLEQKDFGCPQVHTQTVNDNMFKFPKIMFRHGCDKKGHNLNKLVDEIKRKVYHVDNIDFSKSDLNYFKELLELPYETGGDIIKKGNTYKINRKKMTNGKFDTIELTPTKYNFHTHPKPVYNEKNNLTFAAWFSGVDIRYIVANIPYGLKEHFLVAAEGIYKLKPTPYFTREYKKLSEKKQIEIADDLFNVFADLEDIRVVQKKNVLSINNDTIKNFNEFFVTINSLNSSHFKYFNNDFTLFDLEFAFWEDLN